MTCYHPLLLRRSLIHHNTKTGKLYSKVVSRNVDPMTLCTDNQFVEYIPIPCGRCIGCRIDKARDWSVRIMCESMTSLTSYFLTLTYDDEHLTDDLSLNKEHVREFIKDLRNSQNYKYGITNIRHLTAGEYGTVSGRAHYHMILFNSNIPDLKVWKVSKGNVLYTSDYINSLWNRGYVVIGDVTVQSSQYVSRYTLKKLGADDYSGMNIQPPFIMMSTRPGIGYDYFIEHKDELYENFSIFIDHKEASLPKYFLKLLDKFGYNYESKKQLVIERTFDKNFSKMLSSHKSFKKILEDMEVYEQSVQKHKGDHVL